MTTRSAGIARGAIPTGKEEVAAAVLRAAADLFAERGPAATSIRDIASRSKVNHGLVFRHFGAKDQLVSAVLDYLGSDLKRLLDAKSEPDEIERALIRQTRVWARTLLDGYQVERMQFPNLAPFLDHAFAHYDDEKDARLGVANALALQLGWRLFEPMLRSATGLEMLADADLRQAVITESARLIEPH